MSLHAMHFGNVYVNSNLGLRLILELFDIIFQLSKILLISNMNLSRICES